MSNKILSDNRKIIPHREILPESIEPSKFVSHMKNVRSLIQRMIQIQQNSNEDLKYW